MNEEMTRAYIERTQYHRAYQKWRTYFKVGRALLQTLVFFTTGTVLSAFFTHVWITPLVLIVVLVAVVPVVLWLRRKSLRYWDLPLYDHRLFFNR